MLRIIFRTEYNKQSKETSPALFFPETLAGTKVSGYAACGESFDCSLYYYQRKTRAPRTPEELEKCISLADIYAKTHHVPEWAVTRRF